MQSHPQHPAPAATQASYHPSSPITEADLDAFAHLVPPSGVHLLVLLGRADGLRLLNAWPGVQVVVPKGPCNNAGGARRWAQFVGIVGERATLLLAKDMGGECLEVPTLQSLRTERRNAAVRAQFDHMTASLQHGGQGLSRAAAVQELNLLHAPITWRQLDAILDRATVSVPQSGLF
jgi:hypothetical protein